MVKVKNKKTLNPFEVHINKEKIRVLGRKLKNDRGLPGVARAKALKKRKHTLLPEFQSQNRSNKFTDKRIGERNYTLSAEEKSMARYTAVRVKQHKKKSIFNLADDEVLTHRGQTLSEIEKFDDPRSDDDDLDGVDGQPGSGRLEREFVGDAHFGGGMLKKADGSKSYKDLIDQLIVESKKRKLEKQKQKEATLELTEKLDNEWKDLMPLVQKNKQNKEEVVKAKVDDYDKVMRELKFEARGTPSDKLKTEDEIAKEDKEKLERLENERLQRMHGTLHDNATKTKHKSADDLDDNFAYDSDTPDVTLSYNDDGFSNIKIDSEISKGENEGESEGECSDEELETDSEDNLSDLKESDESEGDDDDEEVEEQQGGDDNEEVEEEEEEADDNSEEVEEEEEEGDENNDDITELPEPKKRKASEEPTNDTKKSNKSSEEIKKDLLERKAMMDEARKELPFTFSLPENYESLQATLQGKPPHHHSVIIERMIKCNHPSLKETNKESLALLFVYLLQYISDISDVKDEESLKNCFGIFSNLCPQMFDLAQQNPENCHSSFIEVIKEKYGDYRKKNNTFPKVDVLLYMKLIGCLFTTSDFRHQVVTPCCVFMEQMLSKCKVRSRMDISYGLFIVCLVAEYTALSKRYLPTAIKFLNGIIHMAIPKRLVQILKVLPPFKHTSNQLVLNAEHKSLGDGKLDVTDLSRKDIDDEFRVKALNVSIALLKKFYTNVQQLPSCPEIFQISIDYLKKLPLEFYPQQVRSDVENFILTIEQYSSNRKLDYIVKAKKKPKALRLYEPNIVKVYDGKTHKVQSREKAERSKLFHKIKKEKKGALREIRRDKAFLGRVKINQRIQSDQIRRDKVNQIYREAATQQGELNTMDRKKKRKK